MTDDIEQKIREAAEGASPYGNAQDIAMLAAAVRLMREPGEKLPAGWKHGECHYHHPRGGTVRAYGDTVFEAWIDGECLARCATREAAFAAVEARHAKP